MDYRTAIEFLTDLIDTERSSAELHNPRNYYLPRMEDLLDRVGSPQLGRPTVHIAGTKGKGSTAVMVAAVLRAAGYRTGLFTSPHLHTFRERIAVDGAPIGPDDFAHLVAELRPVVQRINAAPRHGLVTWFEALTCLAFMRFAAANVDIQVLETGMGGRLDATNVVAQPTVCVITPVSLDHTQILGETVEAIATEKAGIIKPGVPVVVAPQWPAGLTVIKRVARERGSPTVLVGDEVRWSDAPWGDAPRGPGAQPLRVWGRRASYELEIPLLGLHQLENAATAVAALEVLGERGVAIPASTLVSGFAAVEWPGRLQVLDRQPWLVVDGAHNPDSAERLAAALRRHFRYRRGLLILGVQEDKDCAAMARAFVRAFDCAIVTRSRHPRSAPVADVARVLGTTGVRVAGNAAGVADALAQARALAGEDDLICAAGSLFIAAETLEAVQGLAPELDTEIADRRLASRTTKARLP